MIVKITYYAPVERKIEMTPKEYCYFRASGLLDGKKVVPDNAIKENIALSKAGEEELNLYFYEKSLDKYKGI